jgi:spore germination cell wall hydrolase CwlJ-like protein
LTAIALETTGWKLPELARRQWRAWALLVPMLALFVLAVLGVAKQAVSPRIQLDEPGSPNAIASLRAAVPQTSATALRQIAPENALQINAEIPVSNLANPPARPFLLGGSSAADRARSLDCLTAAIYYEAAREPTDGQRAVAQVVLNRVRHPAYPNTVCGVVFEGARRYTGCQFSFSCDGSLRRGPMRDFWERARRVAEEALSGHVYAPVGWATHYHANYVVPYWASSLVKSATIGNHIFYRWRGGWGRAPAFQSRYTGVEPAIAWRGGFGQPLRTEAQLAAESPRDAAAAAAAAQAAPLMGSVDSFQRAVLRRYEPLQRDTANAVITERANADAGMSRSQRWALTGSTGDAPQQAPLGRRSAPAEQPRELQGVRYRWDPAPATERTPPPPGGGQAGESSSAGTEATAATTR